MVANHAVVVLSPKIPNREVAVGLVVQNHIFDKLCRNVRLNHGVERVGGAESVPQAECAVIRLPLRHLLDFEIGVHVAAIDIAHGVRLHQNMIQTCVKYGLLLIGAFNVDASKFFLPHVVSVLYIFVKIPTLSLSEHVFARAFVVNRRNSHFYYKFLIII